LLLFFLGRVICIRLVVIRDQPYRPVFRRREVDEVWVE
jgi:hypothetical protein